MKKTFASLFPPKKRTVGVWVTSFSRSLQINLRINLDGTWAEKLLPANAPEECYMPHK